MARRHWTCRKCGHVNAPTKSRKCESCGELTRPKLRKSPARKAHEARSYGDYALLSVLIHGGEPHACGCCGKPRPDIGRHERDHDHKTGAPRGLACTYCNKTVIAGLTLDEHRRAVAYLERAERFAQSVEVAR